MASLYVKIPVPRHITIDEAKERMSHMMEHIGQEFPGGASDLEEHWDGNRATFSFKAKGTPITGTMQVGHNWIEVDSQLPFFLGFFKGKIAGVIKRHATELLAA